MLAAALEARAGTPEGVAVVEGSSGSGWPGTDGGSSSNMDRVGEPGGQSVQLSFKR